MGCFAREDIQRTKEKEVSFLPDGDSQFALFAMVSYGGSLLMGC